MNAIFLLAVIVATVVIFSWLIGFLRSTARTIVAIAAIVLILFLLFGIQPSAIWQQVQTVWRELWALLFSR